MNKFTLHIPCKKYVDGQLMDNGYEKCIDAMVMNLAVIGVHGLYIVDAVGYYKGRAYDEKLMVVFYDCDEVAELFKKVCREFDKELGQEAYAYEKDNELVVFGV